MSCFTIYQDNHTDSTVISNRFIDEYMQAANDAQLKIYLYLLRMMSASRATSISDIADLFNYTEKDVMRALKYWEKQHLLTLDLDGHKNVIGIHLRNFDAPAPTVPVPPAAHPASLASVVPITAKPGTVDNEKPMEQELLQAAPVVSPEEPSEASIDNIYVKPNYTLDELKAFKSDEATARLLFVAEQYLKKTLSATEVKTILFISDKLGFSEDLIDYLIQYCVDRGKKELRYIEKVAISWAQQGVTTPGQAAKLAGKYDKSVYEIMKALGKNGTPTKAEVAYITRWTKEYCFT
ncbi:MAG: DnaD domain protein, partial [Lachnospiraceae bacterium]|nr:DnaD domain protein [Lachnospiraceae bacterium]